ncbi:MAG: ATP-grasp domain-containing protein [Betaproteobacteria bacterium]|nr:ATP-grasp domain-containing protein [Betaproteobacteria bacterium]
MRALSIGAGSEQVASITIAKSLGIKLLALDGRPDAEGAKLADQFICVDLMDAESVLQIAEQFQPNFVLPVPLASPLITAGIVNDALELKGVSEFAARLANDKLKMRTEFTANGVSMAEQILVQNTSDIDKAIEDLGFPLILKPRSGSGSRGVLLIENKASLPEFIPIVPSEDLVIERALIGQEVGIDGAFINGGLVLYALRFKRLTPPPHRQAVSYLAKDPTKEHCFPEIVKLVLKSLKTLRCQNVLFHADVVLGDDGVISLIELSPRPSGHSIHGALLPICYGTNLIEDFILRVYMYKKLPPNRFQKPAFMSFLPLAAGRVVMPLNIEKAAVEGGAITVQCQLKTGDEIGPMIDGSSALQRGYMTMLTDNELHGAQMARRIADAVSIESI